MSLSTLDAASPSGPSSPPSPGDRPRSWLWARVALAVLLVGASAGVRWVRAERYAEMVEEGKKPPFPMEEIPMTLGPWKGEEAKLDSEIARVTGASDMASRIYTDQRTGVKLGVIVLYGPAAKVYIHSPELCYPRSGFRQVDVRLIQTIDNGREKVPFASLLYEKGGGSTADRRQVYYSWRYGKLWSPETLMQKQVDRLPGMFKVHIDRRVGLHEKIDADDPGIEFLEYLMPDLQRRIDEAESRRNPGSRPAVPVS